jgi:hypothetical protein
MNVLESVASVANVLWQRRLNMSSAIHEARMTAKEGSVNSEPQAPEG